MKQHPYLTLLVLMALWLASCAPASNASPTDAAPTQTRTEMPTATQRPTDTPAPSPTMTPEPAYMQYEGTRKDAEEFLGIEWDKMDDWETWGIAASDGTVTYSSHNRYMTIVSMTDMRFVQVIGPGESIELPTSGTYRIFWGASGLQSEEDILRAVDGLAHQLNDKALDVMVAALTLDGLTVVGETPNHIGWDLTGIPVSDPRVKRNLLNMDTVLPSVYVAAEYVVCKDGTTVIWVHTSYSSDPCGGGMKSRNGEYFSAEVLGNDPEAFINTNIFYLMKTAEGYALEPNVRIWSHDVTIGQWHAFDADLFVAPTPSATPSP